MLGTIIFLIILLIGIPVGVMMSGGIGAAIIGHFVREDADKRHEGSELLDLNS